MVQVIVLQVDGELGQCWRQQLGALIIHFSPVLVQVPASKKLKRRVTKFLFFVLYKLYTSLWPLDHFCHDSQIKRVSGCKAVISQCLARLGKIR